MAVFTNIIVSVPGDAQIVSTTGRVYVVREKVYDPKRQYNVDKRITIGKLNSSTKRTMNPNSNYAGMYPAEFQAVAKGKEAPVIKRIGMYTFSLASGYDTQLYPILADEIGPENANFVMDFANYMILCKSNVAKDFEVLMKDQLLFSRKLYSDSTISDFLEKRITKEQIEDFKEKWVIEWMKRQPNGAKRRVWACADGSNNNCEAKEVEIAEGGHAKSRKNIDIYGYMHIIDAVTGEEITYIVYRGGQVDAKAFAELMELLRRYGLELAGIILDRGFCTIDCFMLILDLKISYVIMMPESIQGYKTMVQEHGANVKAVKNLCAPNTYAVEGKARIFKKYPLESKMILCYDNKNGPERENYLTNHVLEAVEKANKEYAENPEKKPTIESKWLKYITIHEQKKTEKPVKNASKSQKSAAKEKKTEPNQKKIASNNPTGGSTQENGKKVQTEQKPGEDLGETPEEIVGASPKKSDSNPKVSPNTPDGKEKGDHAQDNSQLPIKKDPNPYCSINEEALQKAVDEKGYSCLAVSDDISAEVGVKLYDLRDKNEKLYMVIKSQLGSEVARVWYTNGVESKHLIVMVASIIRHKLEEASKQCGYVLTTAIREANFLIIQRTSDNVFFAVNNANGKQEDLMGYLSISYETLSDIAAKETNRVKKIGIPDQIHVIVRPDKDKSDGAESQAPEAEQPEPKKRGRKKGSTNANKQEEKKVEQQPKKHGRPLGSKNKPKTEEPKVKRVGQPGRPKGSLNKKGAVNAKQKRAAAKATKEHEKA